MKIETEYNCVKYILNFDSPYTFRQNEVHITSYYRIFPASTVKIIKDNHIVWDTPQYDDLNVPFEARAYLDKLLKQKSFW